MTEISKIGFHVPGLPQTKGSARAFHNRTTGRAYVTNDNPKNKSWERVVRGVAASYIREGLPWSEPVGLRLTFWLKKPQAHPKTRYSWHTKKPDLSKMIRSVEDALTGIMYDDDRQVIHIDAWKFYSDKPGVDIVVEKINKQIAEVENYDRKKDKFIAEQIIGTY